MTIATLRVDLERELAAWALEMVRPPANWERWEIAGSVVAEHLRVGARVRVPAALMPDWYRGLWFDPTQLDGLAAVLEWNNWNLALVGRSPGSLELATQYLVDMDAFLNAVLDGRIGDAS